MTAEHHHPAELAPIEARVAAIEAILVEKGILDTAAVDTIVAHFEDNLGPMNGARVVARAWSDPAYQGAAPRRRDSCYRRSWVRRAAG